MLVNVDQTNTGNVNPDILSYFVRVTAVDTEKVRRRKKSDYFCGMRALFYINHGSEFFSYFFAKTYILCIPQNYRKSVRKNMSFHM